MIKASCTWGDGPDVLITLEDKPFILYLISKNRPPPRGQWAHGYVSQGSMDLTADEAFALAHQLYASATAAQELDKSYKNTEFPETTLKEKLAKQVARLKRKKHALKLENETLKKAIAIFDRRK